MDNKTAIYKNAILKIKVLILQQLWHEFSDRSGLWKKNQILFVCTQVSVKWERKTYFY